MHHAPYSSPRRSQHELLVIALLGVELNELTQLGVGTEDQITAGRLEPGAARSKIVEREIPPFRIYLLSFEIGRGQIDEEVSQHTRTVSEHAVLILALAAPPYQVELRVRQ